MTAAAKAFWERTASHRLLLIAGRDERIRALEARVKEDDMILRQMNKMLNDTGSGGDWIEHFRAAALRVKP